MHLELENESFMLKGDELVNHNVSSSITVFKFLLFALRRNLTSPESADMRYRCKIVLIPDTVIEDNSAFHGRK